MKYKANHRYKKFKSVKDILHETKKKIIKLQIRICIVNRLTDVYGHKYISCLTMIHVIASSTNKMQ